MLEDELMPSRSERSLTAELRSSGRCVRRGRDITIASRPSISLGKTARWPSRRRRPTRTFAEIELDADAGLADRLWAARETAEAVQSGGRPQPRRALSRALAMAYDFAVAAEREPEDYAEMLEESGVKAQARAPMTPIVKLVFGDRLRQDPPDRIRRRACPMPRRQDVEHGGFLAFIEGQRRPQGAGRGRAPGAPSRAEARHQGRGRARRACAPLRRSRSRPSLPTRNSRSC